MSQDRVLQAGLESGGHPSKDTVTAQRMLGKRLRLLTANTTDYRFLLEELLTEETG